MNREDEILNKINHIEKMLMGNGKVGIAEQARRAFEMCQAAKVSKQGLMDWGFRVLIATGIAYVIALLGEVLKNTGCP